MGGAPSQVFPVLLDAGTGLAGSSQVGAEVAPGLWLGGADVLDDPDFFRKHDISHVLSLGPQSPGRHIPLSGRLHINLPDMPSARLGPHFRKIVLFIAEGRHVERRNTYVHCQAGISRSTTSLCAYLMTHLNITFEQSLVFLSSRRRAVCPNDGFRQQLKVFAVSKDRKTLAQELQQQCSGYEQLLQRDLNDVNLALGRVGQKRDSNSQRSRKSNESTRAVEERAQQNAYQAVQGAIAQGGSSGPPLRIGDGASRDDVGLGWLMKPFRKGTNATRSSSTGPDSTGPVGPHSNSPRGSNAADPHRRSSTSNTERDAIRSPFGCFPRRRASSQAREH